MNPDKPDEVVYAVVVDAAGNYSLWGAGGVPPQGWRMEGKTGTQKECWAYIDEMRAKNRPPPEPQPARAEVKDDGTVYAVVVNVEGYYSIWPAHRENPLGWKREGFVGEKQACLDHIREIWPDMTLDPARYLMDQPDHEH